MDQGFVVLPGQGRLLDLGNFQAVVLTAGGHTSGELTVLQTQDEPAAMVGFFEELSAAEESGTATPSALDEIATRHHMEVLGPVPDSHL